MKKLLLPVVLIVPVCLAAAIIIPAMAGSDPAPLEAKTPLVNSQRPAAIADLIAEAPPAQREALADNHVTREEYEAAIDNEVGCFTATTAGQAKVFGPNWSPGGMTKDWTYRVEGETSTVEEKSKAVGDAARTCALDQSSSIQNVWAIEHMPTAETYEAVVQSFRDCLGKVEGKFSRMETADQLITEAGAVVQGDDPKAAQSVIECMQAHEALSFGPPQ